MLKIKKSIIRKVFNFICYLAAGFIFVISAFVIYSNMKGEIGYLGGYTFIWVKTESMEPSIPQKSYILVKKTEAKDVKVDDIVVFISDDPEIQGQYNTHRVVEIIGKNEEFVTRGDNNMIPDKYTAKAANVQGVFVANLPVLSAFGRAMATPTGIMIAVAAIFGIMAAVYMPEIKALKKEQDEEIKRIEKERFDALVKAEVERLKQQNIQTDPNTAPPAAAPPAPAQEKPETPENPENPPVDRPVSEQDNQPDGQPDIKTEVQPENKPDDRADTPSNDET